MINFILGTIFFIGGTGGNIKHCDCPDEPYGGVLRISSFLKDENPDLIIDVGNFLAPIPDRKHHAIFMKCYKRIQWNAVAITPYDFTEGIDFLLNYNLPYISGNMKIKEIKKFIKVKNNGKTFLIFPLFSEDYENPEAPITPIDEFVKNLPKDYDYAIVIAYLSDNSFEKLSSLKNPIIINTESSKRSVISEKPFVIGYTRDGKYGGIVDISTKKVNFIPLDSTIPEDLEIKKIFEKYIAGEKEEIIKIKDTLNKETTTSKDKYNAMLFYSEDCEHCIRVITKFLPEFKKNHNIKFQFYELNEYENLEKLEKIKKEYKLEGEDELPYIFINGRLLGGEKFIVNNLDKYVSLKPYKTNKNIDSVITNKEEIQFVSKKQKELVYFYTPGCKECDRVHIILNVLKKKFKIIVKEYSVSKKENGELLYSFGEVYGIEKSKRMLTPILFIGKDYLLKDEINLEAIKNLLKKDDSIPWKEIEKNKKQSSKKLVNTFKQFQFYTVIVAGLIDGINPCAFALLIFFLTYLSILPDYKKKILYVGISFIFGVFITYFTIGLILNHLVFLLQSLKLVIKILFLIIALLTIFFGIMNLIDFIKVKKGKAEKMTMVLPQKLKKLTHKIIRSKLMFGGIVLGAFITAVMVSFVELVCTGQIYLPTIMYVISLPGLKAKGLFFLLLYNIAFVFPLVIILILFYSGITEKTLQLILKKNTALIKILTATFFFLLSGFIILSLYMGWI